MEGTRTYTIQVLGRTLEHLGAQMYKRRDTAIAELVANCWDAGATQVDITVDVAGYDRSSSKIVITDNGVGMTEDEVQSDYLVVGRNRRSAGAAVNPAPNRKVMGRKGIGKLAGFGIASHMEVSTWRNGPCTAFSMDMEELKRDATAEQTIEPVPILARTGAEAPTDTPSGTRIILSRLKHSTPIGEYTLRESLARRFSRVTRGEMSIRVNGVEVADPEVSFEQRVPESGYLTHALPGGGEVRYFFGFSDQVLSQSLMRGFAVYVNGKIAQTSPFYFFVEGTASGQHGTRYLHGEIHADFLDEGIDDESDVISTDRQEIDWESDAAKQLSYWGQELTRKALREWAGRRGTTFVDKITSDPEFSGRIDVLDEPSRTQVHRFLQSLGQAGGDQEKIRPLADSVIRAFEYRHFHDIVADIEEVSDDPERLEELMGRISKWKVLESRAILEVIDGRIAIIDKFNNALVMNISETANPAGTENLHDLIAWYPWLIDPEWQVLYEEKQISKQLREWKVRDFDEQDLSRYDFLALAGDGRVKVIEIKRSGHTVTRDDVQKLDKYVDALSKAHPKIDAVFISGDSYEFPLERWNSTARRLTWNSIYDQVSKYYDHYREVLRADVSTAGFDRKRREVMQTRRVLELGAYRSPADRKAGLGVQDVSYEDPAFGPQGDDSGTDEDEN
ncbi:ATP-binding protein [Streptomyces sp. TRM68416]|uniref:ATP-binding protein n=1 Tax=Streptomyces sp. TRM68416 TaxID=2758412 RepID=UPI001661F04A|nr:ATP-binding protein [Streptomyces sp. TRM68416]MBD0843277.1 ATP-binding protein [Streptomyces sp. TRM68416]